jgi:hypothetical protein
MLPATRLQAQAFTASQSRSSSTGATGPAQTTAMPTADDSFVNIGDRLSRALGAPPARAILPALYVGLDLELPVVVVTFLDDATALYHRLGSAEAENEMLALKAQFAAARGGVHPLTLERVTSRRREMERSIALRVLLVSADRLRTDCAEVRQTLATTRDRLAPLALYAFQKGLLPAG